MMSNDGGENDSGIDGNGVCWYPRFLCNLGGERPTRMLKRKRMNLVPLQHMYTHPHPHPHTLASRQVKRLPQDHSSIAAC